MRGGGVWAARRREKGLGLRVPPPPPPGRLAAGIMPRSGTSWWGRVHV